MRVLVTGAFGWTARSIVSALGQQGHEIIAFDCAAEAPSEVRTIAWRTVSGDVRDYKSVFSAADSAEAAVHLAVASRPDSYASAELPFAVNVLGTYNLFEAARKHKLQRVVLISEAPVHIAADRPAILPDWRSSAGNDHLYDLTKRLQEETAKDYAETYGMRVVTLRTGHVVDGRASVDRRGINLKKLSYCRGGWVCRFDVAAAVTAALNLPGRGYEMYYVVGSWQARERYEIERTEAALGVTLVERFKAYE